MLAPRVFVPLLSVFFLGINFLLLFLTISNPQERKWIVRGDSSHYIQMAGDFAKGDFQCRYVIKRPHRQLLYPLLLAPAAGLSGNDPFWMGTVNIGVGLVGVFILYFGILRLYQNRAIAAASGVLFAGNLFIVQQVSANLMTEPLHIVIVILAAFFFLNYIQQGKKTSLYIAAACVGLDYLTRANGLFLMISMMAVVLVYELGSTFLVANRTKWLRFQQMAGGFRAFAVAGVVFVVVSFPSWVPRLVYLHNPIAHGYLSNYMWVDSYNVGHTGHSYVSYTWRDYVATHGVMDVVYRWGRGFTRVLFTVPLQRERVPILYFLAVAGVVMAVRKRDKSHMLLAAVMAIQLLPLVWTNLSNPTQRVAYGALIPFEFFFAAFALNRLRIHVSTITANKLQTASAASLMPGEESQGTAA